jgi:hypothetical protein
MVGDAYLCMEDQVLLAVGSLCLKYGQRELWSRIYDTVNDVALPGDDMKFLEETAAAVRSGAL